MHSQEAAGGVCCREEGTQERATVGCCGSHICSRGFSLGEGGVLRLLDVGQTGEGMEERVKLVGCLESCGPFTRSSLMKLVWGG